LHLALVRDATERRNMRGLDFSVLQRLRSGDKRTASGLHLLAVSISLLTLIDRQRPQFLL
jgi:hypothetical protein